MVRTLLTDAASSTEEEEEEEGQASSDSQAFEWDKLPRSSEDVASMIRRPSTARLRNLLRHVQLNPTDTEIPYPTWIAAEAELAPYLRKLSAAERAEAQTGSREMRELVAAGRAIGVKMISSNSEDGIEWSMPSDYMRGLKSVYGVQTAPDHMGYAFTLSQLPETSIIVQVRETLLCDYASRACDFMTKQGTMDANMMSIVLESVFSSCSTLR